MVKIRQARSSATWPLLLILLALSAATSIQARSTVRVLLAGLPSTINTASEAAYLYSLANVWSATSGIDLTFQWNTIAGVANDTASNFGWDTLTVFNNANKAATAGSADIVMFDGVYTGMMAPLLKNLSPLIPAASVAAHMPQAVAASTVAGKLYALPMTLDVALLYYRMDVLQRNGFTAPPTTWDAMGSMLSTIVSAEKARNPAIMGFLGQLRGYEGLTAFTTEWLASVANTTWLTDTLGLPTGPAGAKKQVALDAMTRLRTWITSGIIGAPAIMCDEQYSADFWGQGNAVVMRHWNWMPAYSGSVSFPWVAAPYPGSISALGGLVAGIVDSTTDAAAAAAALQFLASAQMQTARAVNSGMIPTIPALWSDPTVCNAIQICDKIKAMNFVARPSVPAGSQYLTISSLIWSNWVNMLNGQQTPAVALDSVNFGIGQTLGIDLLGPPTNIDRTNPIALFIFVVCAIGLVLTFLVTMYIGAGRAGLPLPVRVKSSIPPAASRQGSISKTSAAVAGARTGNTGGVSGSTGGIALEREGIVGYRSSRSRWWKWAARWRGARMIVFPAQGIVVFEPVDAMDSTDMGDVIGLDEIASVAVLNASGIPTPTPTDPSSDSPDSPTSPAALTGTESATPTVHEVKVVITIKNLPLEYEIMAPSRAEALQWEATLRAAAASSVSMSSVPLAGSAAQPPMLQLGGKDDRKRKLASATASVIGTATVSPPQPPPSIPVGMVMVNSASFGTDALGRRVSVVVDDGV
ncbi:hypothetical protein BC828DRAFT_295751 [Blastocladiella britannica]|nr:hypothetical protein BC828DRAFT_295751 [Blastocladiella britannica]